MSEPPASPSGPSAGAGLPGQGRGLLVVLVLLLLALLAVGFGIGYVIGSGGRPIVAGIAGAFVGSLVWSALCTLVAVLLRRSLLRQGVDAPIRRSRRNRG